VTTRALGPASTHCGEEVAIRPVWRATARRDGRRRREEKRREEDDEWEAMAPRKLTRG